MKNTWKSFLSLCLKTHDTEELSRLFDCFFTIEEKEAIANRYLIIQGLIQGKQTQREMSEALHVSIAKITRGSNALKSIDAKLKHFLEKNTL